MTVGITPKALAHLSSSQADAPSPDDPRFARHIHHIVASASVSLEAAARYARSQGIQAVILSDSIQGEACDAGLLHAAIAREVAIRGRPFAKPVVILSGGETVVTLRGEPHGKGGRNAEFALAAAIGIDGFDIHALAADTDGIDGSEDNAGAFIDGSTIGRMRHRGIKASDLLRYHDSFTGFSKIDDLLFTGPTGTNVNDLRMFLIP